MKPIYRETVKVIKPLSGPSASGLWTIRDINSSRLVRVPATIIPKHVKSIMSNCQQAYFMASYSIVTGWTISETVVHGDSW